MVLKALAKDPRDRFQRAGEMVTALQQAVAGKPVMTAAISLADERIGQQEKLAALYAEAVALLKAGEWQKALEKWVEVQAMDPTYIDSQQVAATAKRELARLEAAATPLELRLPIPLWRKVPVWVWVAIGGVILLAAAIAGTTRVVSPVAGELAAAVSPTSTPEPPTLTPTADVAATETALAGLAANVMATALAQASATMGASMPTPTDTLIPTQTPVPPTATATHTPAPPTPTPVPGAIPQPAGSITLTVYLRDTRTGTGFVTLSAAQPYGWKIYEEGRFVYGEAAVLIGNTVYHFDEPGELGQLPDPWRVEFEFAEALVAHTGHQAGFDARQAQFWVGTLDDTSAVGGDNPYTLTVKLYEGDALRETIQVWFTVADQGDFSESAVFSAEEVGAEGRGGGPPIVPPGQGGEPPGQAKDKKEPPGKSK